MVFCTNCGAAVPEGAEVCPACGAPQPQRPGQQPYQQQYRQPPQYQQAYYPPQDPTLPKCAPEDIEKNRVLSLFAYLGAMLLLPLIAQPESQYCRFHANQGTALLLFELCCAVVCIVPVLGWIVGAIGGVFAFVCEIVGVVNALTGRVSRLPLIGKWEILH